jgi:hypothetical protein
MIKWNDSTERKNHIRGIICQLILYKQGTVLVAMQAQIDLKMQLWKLLRQSNSNKHIMSEILITLNHTLEDEAKPIIYGLSEEFELHIEVFKKFQSLKSHSTAHTVTPDLNNMDNGKLKDLESIMEEPTFETPLNNNLKDKGVPTNSTFGKEFSTDFIPKVVKVEGEINTSSLELQEKLLTDHDMEFLMEFLDLEDFEINPYEGISKEFEVEKNGTHKAKRDEGEASFLNLDFLPILFEVEEEKEAVNPSVDIYDIEVDCEVVIDPYIKKQISDMLKSHVKEQIQENTIINEDDILDLGGMQLPVAKFYSNKESKRVKLLHAIAELGDIREVALLSEMMDVEENESIGNLIKEIIFKFLAEYPLDENEEERNSTKLDFGNHYVFNRLFNALDMESQLILLDEIETIGEQHELDFVKTLHNHPIRNIREKAQSVTGSLCNKLGIEDDNQNANQLQFKKENISDSGNTFKETSDTQLNPSKKPMAFISYNDKHTAPQDYMESNDIFKIDFDMAPPEKLIDSNPPNAGKSTYMQQLEEIHFLEQLKDLTNKIFNR